MAPLFENHTYPTNHRTLQTYMCINTDSLNNSLGPIG